MPKFSPDITIPGLSINRKSKVAAYKQLYKGMQSLIINGQLRPKERLPSTRTLAQDLGISRNIVLLAYEQLTLEGYITSNVGSGSYVSDHIQEIFTPSQLKISGLKKSAKPTIEKNNISFNYPLHEKIIKRDSSKGEIIPFERTIPALDEFPYRAWVKCAYKVFRGFEFLHLGYDDAQGYLPLRESITSYLRTNRALHCEPDQIVIVNGSQQALNLIADLLFKKNDQFWMDDPGYPHTTAVFKQKGAKPCFIPVTKNGTNIDWAIKHYPKAKLVDLTPSNQFPLGGTLPVSKRIQLLNWAAKKNMWILEDDYDSEFRYFKKPVPSLQGLDQHKRVIYLGTFTKVLFPALRIGYLVLPDKEMAKTFAEAKAFSDRQNSITDQAIVHEFMKEGYFYTHLRKMRFLYKKRQDFLISIIDKYGKGVIKIENQNSGMLVIGWLHDKLNDQEVAAYLEKAGVKSIALSLYTQKHKHKPALILGYTAFNEKKIKEYTLLMIEVIKKFMSSKKIVI